MKPLYRRLIDYIVDRIRSGELQEGDMLPTEAELCSEFQMSRQTVRTALLSLVNDGYLVRIKGKGTFVTKPKTIEDTTIFLESFSKEMERRGYRVKSEVLELRSIRSPAEIAEKLNTPEQEEVIKLKRLRYQEGNFESGPIVLTTSWFPKRFSYLLKYDFEQTSLHDVYMENKTRRKSAEKEVSARILSSRDCRLIGVPVNSLAVLIASITFDQDDALIEYSESYYPAERNEFKMKVAFP